MKENSTETTIVSYSDTQGKLIFTQVEQKSICPGQVVYFKKGDRISVDIVTLHVDKEDKEIATFIATDLTGEPGNLPSKPIRPDVDVRTFIDLRAKLECFACTTNINDFSGLLHYRNEAINVEAENTIPAGAILTSHGVMGVCYATGDDRKCQMIQEKTTVKASVLDTICGQFMIYNVYALSVMVICCTVLSVWFDIPTEEEQALFGWAYWVVRIIQNFMIYNGMIPLSLSINMSLVRGLQMIFNFATVGIDVNNTTLTGDLCNVQYIMSDKTGTLTKNEMVFQNVVDSKLNSYQIDSTTESASGTQTVDSLLLRCLGLCTTARPVISAASMRTYDAQNQEDLTIIQRSIHLGCQLVKRKGDRVTLDIINHKEAPTREKWTVLHEFEFSSERKCMGVVVQKGMGEIYIFEKGAGSIIRAKLSDNTERSILDQAQHKMDQIDPTLRSMACAYRECTDDWKKYQHQIETASSRADIDERKALLSSLLENNLKFLGFIGIQDELQDGVPETISKLQTANIKFAMLTGDRTMTAVNVAMKAKMLKENSPYVVLDVHDVDHQLQEFVEKNSQAKKENTEALILSSEVFSLLWDTRDEKERRWDLFCKCLDYASCLIGTRLMPQQKARLVMVMQMKGFKTMAIGDGANDVGAIEQADIGVGIKGLDGAIAARKADFAISKFSVLGDLLLVHGYNCYMRNALVAKYIFYKCTCVTWALLWFSLLYGFDGRSLFPGSTIVGFNLLWTAPLIVESGVNYVSETKAQLRANTAYYRFAQKSSAFTLPITLYWVANGVLHSFIVVIGYSVLIGKEHPLYSYLCALSLAIVINSRLFIHETVYKTIYNTGLFVAANLSYFLFLFVNGEFWPLFFGLPSVFPQVCTVLALSTFINVVLKKGLQRVTKPLSMC
eukprot:TRINITY_DN13041_c0_g1_i1.p1 TRINITY_DN13041_c0_g1~~TRINITY_DN13041_c0_g1_i1.p1  ORF type:complete len:1021 (+),score=196.04 TRINITY_DN13041_c0_g1_i1:367-3063(+)